MILDPVEAATRDSYQCDLGVQQQEIQIPKSADLPNPDMGERQEKYGEPGYPPIDAYHEIGRTELKKRKELGPISFDRTLTPEDLELEIGGSFTEAIEGVNIDNAQIDLNGQTHELTSTTSIDTSGSFSLKNGTLKVRGDNRYKLRIDAKQAQVSNLTFDVTDWGAAMSLYPETDGSFQISNIVHKGFQGDLQRRGHGGASYKVILPQPRGSGHIRVEQYRATGGVQAAAHTQNNTCPNWSSGGTSFSYIGPGTAGSVDFINCEVANFQNAYYCSKNSCRIRVIGGKYVNNSNATLRLASPGEATGSNQRCRGTGCSIYYNQEEYPEDQPGNPYKVGEIQGLNAMRSESLQDSLGPLLDHIDVHAYNIETNPCGNGGFDGIFKWKDDVGGSTVENCRFTGKNIPATPAINAEKAGQSAAEALKPKYAGTPPQPWGIQMSGLELVGDFFDDAAINVEGNRKSQSSIKDSCIHAATGPQVIVGVPSGRISNIGYGPNCSEAQTPSGQVGTAGNISSLPMNVSAGNYSLNGSAMPGAGGAQRSSGPGIIEKIVSSFVSLLVTVLLILIILTGLIAGIVIIAGAIIYQFGKS